MVIKFGVLIHINVFQIQHVVMDIMIVEIIVTKIQINVLAVTMRVIFDVTIHDVFQEVFNGKLQL